MSIKFLNGIDVDNGVLYTDTTNNRVGIGTISPAVKLQVDGKIRMAESALYPLNIGHVASTSRNQIASSNGGLDIIAGYQSQIIFKDATDTNMTINGYDGNVIMGYGASRVGIGTSSPAFKLDVNGGARLVGNLLLCQGSTSNQYLNISQSFSSTFINTGTSGETIFFGAPAAYQSNIQVQGNIIASGGSSNTSFQTINNTSTVTNYIPATGDIYFNGGEVGIGTTSPNRKLHVVGTDGAAKLYYNSSFTNAQYSVIDVGMMTSGTAANGFGPKITFRMGGNGYDGYSAGAIGTVRNGADGTHNMTFATSTSNSVTTKMTITNTGNVGIGTTTPGEKLEVDGHVKAVDGYKGYVSYFHNAGFFHSPRSQDGANPLFIPINSTGMSSSDQYYNTWVPLYAGRVRKIIIKHISGSTPVATACTFRKKINGTLSGTTYAGTVTSGGSAGMKVTFDFGTTNFTFNAEDEVQIGFVTGVATQPRMGGCSCQIWYEYNIT